MFESFLWLSADAAAAGPKLRPFVSMRNAVSAGPDELLNDCHFSFYFKRLCVMASYRHSVYLRPLPYATFIYGPEYKLEREKKKKMQGEKIWPCVFPSRQPFLLRHE